ncbi:MAG: hypothetical protein IJU29_10350 [Oscillospiraceae bacterium]|nr:hypothetical protein [Oscillospiraceae bacterium]
MLETHMLNPKGYKNVTGPDGKVCGFSLEARAPYYRGFSLSIVRNIAVTVDGVEYPREDLLVTVNGETFTLEEMRTVISNRWLFGKFATITVKKDGGLAPGNHHADVTMTLAPSYMPMQLVRTGHGDFTI